MNFRVDILFCWAKEGGKKKKKIQLILNNCRYLEILRGAELPSYSLTDDAKRELYIKLSNKTEQKSDDPPGLEHSPKHLKIYI